MNKITKGVKELKDRATAKTPKFWKKMQIAGAIVAGIGTIIISAPISIPAGIIATGTYLLTVGGTITAIAQLTKE